MQGRVVPPGSGDSDAESALEAEPLLPPDAEHPTQTIGAVRDDNSPQAPSPVEHNFGGRPMFRDEAPGGDGQNATTAEIDLSDMDGRESSRLPDRNKLLMLAGGFAALLAIGGGGAFLLAANASGGVDIGAVSGSGALAPGEVFPDTVDVAGESYELLITDDTEQCSTAAHGDYGDVLDGNDCEQIVRASYANEDSTRAVTVGVAAMASPEDAEQAQQAQDLEKGEWFAGLNGKSGTGTERMEFAAGHGSGAQWDRYLIFSLAADSDGRITEDGMSELGEISEGFAEVPHDDLSERLE